MLNHKTRFYVTREKFYFIFLLFMNRFGKKKNKLIGQKVAKKTKHFVFRGTNEDEFYEFTGIYIHF